MNNILVIDPSKCTGCRSCEVACSTVKENEVHIEKSRIRIVPFYQEYFYYPNVCFHCDIPYCALPCPTSAITKSEDTGIVELNEERCVGCKMCLLSCPFGATSFLLRNGRGKAIKCDLCEGDPVCVKACKYEALTYGEPDEMGAGKRVAVAEKVKKACLTETLTLP
jgi:Fe-S-cluster-containing dehydrogenase component